MRPHDEVGFVAGRWLRYHRSLGIYHVFVHVEDTPELLPLLDSAEFKDFVTVTTGDDNSLDTHNPNSSDNYYTLMQRQERQVRRSVQSCRQAGIEWLFHVDDDELLYFDTPFSKIVDSLPREVTCVVLVNIEAVPDTLTSECIFEVRMDCCATRCCRAPPHPHSWCRRSQVLRWLRM